MMQNNPSDEQIGCVDSLMAEMLFEEGGERPNLSRQICLPPCLFNYEFINTELWGSPQPQFS